MADFGAHALAGLYLGQFSPSFWEWTVSGDALVWSDGTTIVFRDELGELLARLAHRGLPSLSVIALVLAACREGYREPAGLVTVDLLSRLVDEQRPAFEEQLLVAYEAMDAIAAMPAHLRRGVDAKATLLETVLADAESRLSADEAELVVKALAEGVVPAKPGGLVEWAPPSLFELSEDLAAIHGGAMSLDAQALERRRLSGVEDELLPADVELPDSERVRQLLAELRTDQELSGLARLARDLLATVQVPRSISARDDQPVGGVSDISNRGPLHRLLVSELAHDSLTFAVRIATGEALYLRREAPPHSPTRRRVVLLDTGIRMWGVGRVYATAVGLALAASAGKEAVSVFRAEEGELIPVDLTTREGVASHLEALEPSPQPGRALRRLLADAADDPHTDVVLVTHRNVPTDPAFRRELAQAKERLHYIASIDSSGSYVLEARTPRGQKLVGKATLDLEPLLSPGPKRFPGQPLREGSAPGLPSILSLDPFPILLPARLDPARVASHPLHGVVGVTEDGRLLHWAWRRWDVGGRQLTAQVPKGALHWIEIDDEGIARVAIHQMSTRSLVVLSANTESGHVRRFAIGQTERSLLSVTRVGNLLALIHPWHVDAVCLERGTLAESLRLPDRLSWVQSRFFCGLTDSGREWHALSWQGGQLHLEQVPLDEGDDVSVLWDRWGHDGPWAFRTSDGSVLCVADGSSPLRLSRDGPVGFHGVSRDGHRLVVQERRGGRYLLDLESVSERRIYVSNYLRALQREPGMLAAKSPQMRKRFHSIGLDQHGHLALVSRRNRIVPLRPDARGDLLLGPGAGDTARLSFLRPFTLAHRPPGARYRLRTATWPAGSRAILDSRGLLHLLPANGPELTIVLVDQGPLTTWSTDGSIAGSAYFLGQVRTDSEACNELLQQFVASLG